MAVIKKTLSLHPLYVIFHVIEIFYIYNSFKIASFCEDVHFYVILRKEQMWVPYKLKNTTIKIYSWVNKQANGNWLTCQIFLSQNSKIKTGFQVLYFFRLWKLTIALLILSMFSMLKTVGQTEKLLRRQKNVAR